PPQAAEDCSLRVEMTDKNVCSAVFMHLVPCLGSREEGVVHTAEILVVIARSRVTRVFRQHRLQNGLEEAAVLCERCLIVRGKRALDRPLRPWRDQLHPAYEDARYLHR